MFKATLILGASIIVLLPGIALNDAQAEENKETLETLQQEITQQRQEIERQAAELEQRRSQLDALERRLVEALGEGEPDGAPAPAVEQAEKPVVVAERDSAKETDFPFVADEASIILTGEDLIDADFPGSFPLFGTNSRMRIGGYVKADAIFDFDGHLDRDQFLLAGIAVDGSPEAGMEGYFNAHARESRFNLDVRDTTPGETPKQLFIEVDFFTGPDEREELRLRHAYAVFGNVLAGRTWTTVSELRALPFMIDFAFGDSLFGGRTEQIRYQTNINENVNYVLALENPSDNNITNPLGLPGRTSPALPYLAGRLSFEHPGSLLTLGAQVQQLRWDGEGQIPEETATGWGVILAGRKQITDRTFLTGTASYSDGFSDAILALAGGGASAVITPDGLDTDRAVTLSAGLSVNWSDTWSSNFHYAWLDRSGDEPRLGSDIDSGGIGHINAIWRPTDKLRTGVEYIWGYRENLDGASGNGSRLMGTVRYDLGVPY